MQKLFHMSRTLIIIGTFLLFSFSLHAQSTEPQQEIERFEQAAKDLRPEVKDSIRNVLMSRYIHEYRTYGKEIALDSLGSRVDRLLGKKREPVRKSPEKTVASPTNELTKTCISSFERIVCVCSIIRRCAASDNE